MKARLPLLLALLFLFSCQPEPQARIQSLPDTLQARNNDLLETLEIHVGELLVKEQALNEIEDSLSALLRRNTRLLKSTQIDSSLLVTSNKKTFDNQRAAILRDISQINLQVDWLRTQLIKNGRLNHAVTSRLDSLQGQIHMRDLHITELGQELQKLRQQIENIKKVQRKKERINQIAMSDIRNKSSLRKQENLLAEWYKGFYTIGGINDLNLLLEGNAKHAQECNLRENYLDYFPKDKDLHYTRNTSIFCQKKIVKVLPERKANTYKINGQILEITKPEHFWSMPERALVIVTE